MTVTAQEVTAQVRAALDRLYPARDVRLRFDATAETLEAVARTFRAEGMRVEVVEKGLVLNEAESAL